jgi:RNA polymerase sigma-70 factor (ECF subfamily)
MGEENAKSGPPVEDFEIATLPYLKPLFRFAVRLTANPAAAEDLVQETYLRALQSFGTVRDQGSVRPWLFRILSRLVIDRHRAYGREVPLEGSEDLDRFSLYDRIADEDPLPYSDNLHDRLPGPVPGRGRASRAPWPSGKLPNPLVLLHAEEMSYRDIAEVIGARSVRSCLGCTADARFWSANYGSAPESVGSSGPGRHEQTDDV